MLTKLFNIAIEQATFRTIFKTAKVVPVYKNGSKLNCSNYRPISLLCLFSKLLEKCIYDQLYHYLKRNQLLYEYQFGFRENLSTELAINQIYEDFVRGVESKEITCSVFVDLKKAFDTVDYSILRKKLNCDVVRGLPLKFLSSYLTNRQQYTVVHLAESSVKSVSCGVPQGLTLGPLLFLIYINDLPNTCNLRIRLFADDANLTMSNKSKALLENHMNNELIKVDEWLKTNKLSLNYDKTEFLAVNKSKSKGGSLNIRIGKNEIAQVKHVKYLGVIIDEDLSWKPHIHNQCSKIAHGNWAITNLRKYVNLSTLKCFLWTDLSSPSLLFFRMGTGKQNLSKTCSNP